MITTNIHTKIYGIKQSNKGWSSMYAYYFHRHHAIEALRKCNKWKQETGSTTNFRLIEIQCIDSIIYTTDK